MPNINKSVLNSNLNFIQLKLYDFSDEKIDQEKIKDNQQLSYFLIEAIALCAPCLT